MNEMHLPITLDGCSLTLPEVARLASDHVSAQASPAAMERAAAAHHTFVRETIDRPVYGANTGVGANKNVSIHEREATTDRTADRLLRSHCAGFGVSVSPRVARMTTVIRLNQLLAGNSGISPAVLQALAEAVSQKSVAELHTVGAIGTADLSAMAELALTLAGERRWRENPVPAVTFADSDALPFLSSSALTLAVAADASLELDLLLQAALVVSALSFVALEGSREAIDVSVQNSRPYPGQSGVMEQFRALLGESELQRPGQRVQDPFGLRVIPQVHAAAAESAGRLTTTLEREINAGIENPLIDSGGIRHHGQFHLAMLAGVLDHARTSTYPVLSLSATRLSLLLNPTLTGLSPFLAAGPRGSSGLMITEYVAHDALATLRVAATPVSGGSATLSLGAEEHASFASHGARLLHEFCTPAWSVLAVEAIAAVRLLRMKSHDLGGSPLVEAWTVLDQTLDRHSADRPLGSDIEAVIRALPQIASVYAGEATE